MARGRKPSHVVASGQDSSGQAGIWATIRLMREFTVQDIEQKTRASRRSVHGYLKSLEASGRLERDKAVIPHQWKLIRDTGVEVPRLRADGSRVTQGNGTAQMWRVMRTVKFFTVEELAVTASTAETPVSHLTARSYAYTLAKAGYLKRREGEGGVTRFRFVRDTGPKAPEIQTTKQVFDRNTQEVVWPSRGDQP